MSDDDDLRFGDVDHERRTNDSDSGRKSGSGVDIPQTVGELGNDDIAPILVTITIAGYLVITQPVSGTISGVSLNWFAVALVLFAGLTATSST